MSLWIFKIPMTPAFNIPMTALCEYSKYPWRHFMNIQNTHVLACEYSNCTWRHFMHTQNSLNYRWPHLMNTQIHEYSKDQLHHSMNFQNTHGVGIRIFKLLMRHFEYSLSDVMGILNIQKKCNFEYVTLIFGIFIVTLVFWIFLKWCHGYFEYSKEVEEFWIFKNFEYVT